MKQRLKTDGFTLIDLLIVIAVLFILVVMLMPSRRGGKAKAPRIACTNHLKQVGIAFRIWSGDHNGQLPMDLSVTNGGAMEAFMRGNVAAVFQVMSNELNTPRILFCPTDKKRIQAVVFNSSSSTQGNPALVSFANNSNLSYFVGLDINTNLPGMFLSGDDNFLLNDVATKPGILSLTTNTPVAWSKTRHEKQGNVGLADGSVQGFSSTSLRNALANTGVETNRLAMP